jgi:WD40 repeat protein
VILFTILLPDSGSISPLSLAFGPEGNLLVAGGRMGEVLLWDAWKSEEGGGLDPGSWKAGGPLGAKSSIFRRSRISHIEFSPDRKVLAIGSNGSVVLWNRETLKSLGLEPPIGLFTGFCFTPDGMKIAQAGSTGLVVLNDVASGSVDSVLSKYERTASALAFSPNERLLAIGNADGTIGFLEIGEGSQSRFTPSGHRGAVNAVRFHPDGRSLASAGEDGMVALWDLSKPKGEGLQTVQQIGSLRLPSEPVSAATALAFSSDGKTLAVANRKGQIFNWSLSSGARAYAFLAGEEPSLDRVLAQEFAFESINFSTIWKLKPSGSATWLFYVPGETAERIAEFLSRDPSDASVPGFDLAQVLSSFPFGQVLVIVDAPVEERELAAARNFLRKNRRGGICTCLSAPLEDLVAANAPNGLSFMDAVVQALEVSPGLTSGRELAEEVAGILGRRPTYSSLTDAGPPGRDFYFPAKVYAPLASEGGQKDQNASSERSKRERPRTSGAQKPPEGK